MTDRAIRRWIVTFSRRRADAIAVTGPPREIFARYPQASIVPVPPDVDLANLNPAQLITLKDQLEKLRWGDRQSDEDTP